MGLTRCRKNSVIFWGLLRKTIKMEWDILACGTITVYASTSFMLAYFFARLLNATYISFLRTRISTPNNVRFREKNQSGKKWRLIRACTVMHCRSQKCTTSLPAAQTTLRVLALELTSPQRSRLKYICLYQWNKFTCVRPCTSRSPYLSSNLVVSKVNAYKINTPMHHIQLWTNSYYVHSS